MTAAFTAAKQREIQEQVAEADQQEVSSEPRAMQAGARRYPAPPFPEQHQDKPGDEAALVPAAMYDAPFYIGSAKLKDKVALITGATAVSGDPWRCCLPGKAPISRSFTLTRMATPRRRQPPSRRKVAAAW